MRSRCSWSCCSPWCTAGCYPVGSSSRLRGTARGPGGGPRVAAGRCHGCSAAFAWARRHALNCSYTRSTLGMWETKQVALLFFTTVTPQEARPSGALCEAMLQGEVDAEGVSWAGWPSFDSPAQIVRQVFVLTGHHLAGPAAGKETVAETVGSLGRLSPCVIEQQAREVLTTRGGGGRDGAAGSQGAFLDDPVVGVSGGEPQAFELQSLATCSVVKGQKAGLGSGSGADLHVGARAAKRDHVDVTNARGCLARYGVPLQEPEHGVLCSGMN
ncbi:hypothetical protein QFZ32_000148 [Streptomyces canus]|nr:hypothetical protein [Streptomyces canus]